jgi:hypothetical protein
MVKGKRRSIRLIILKDAQAEAEKSGKYKKDVPTGRESPHVRGIIFM